MSELFPQPIKGIGGYGTPGYGNGQGMLANNTSVDGASMWDMFQSLLGGAFDKYDPKSKTTNQGWLAPSVGAVTGLASAWTGMEQLDLAKQQLAFNKEQFNKNFAAQRGVVNSQLADRQASRLSANPNSYMAMSQYMDKYGVK